MAMLREYLTVDEAISYLDNKVNDAVDYKLSIKKIIENAIFTRELKPLVKFNGFASLYRYKTYEEQSTSVELKQIAKIQGYFYAVETIYPSEFNSEIPFSNLDDLDSTIHEVIVGSIVNYENLVTYCKINNPTDKDIGLFSGKNYNLPDFIKDYDRSIQLYPKIPIIRGVQSLKIEEQDSVKISKRDIYLKLSELDKVLEKYNIISNDNLEKRLQAAQSRILELEKQLEQANQPQIDEGQGDTLLILGAVMECVKDIAKPNYTQQNLIEVIKDKYPHVDSLSQSTLTKKFPIAKKYLKQRLN